MNIKSFPPTSYKLLFNRLPFFAVIGLVVTLGAAFLLSSHAATTTIAVEPELGSVALPATTVNDPTASLGSAVKFGVASANVGGTRLCPAYPAFPDLSCTGVPAGTQLITINGDLTTSSDGQIIDGKLITGDVGVLNANVTIKNSRILGRIANKASNGLSITDSDIGPDVCPTSSSFYNNLNGTNYTLSHSRVHNAGADIMGIGGMGTILIKESIVNQACIYPGDHLDAMQFYSPGDVGKITVQHTVIDSRPVNAVANGNAAIFWADNPGSGSRLNVTQSKLAGGNYTASLYDATATSGVVLSLIGNTFVKNSYTYGACASANSVAYNGTSGIIFMNNIYDDGSNVGSC